MLLTDAYAKLGDSVNAELWFNHMTKLYLAPDILVVNNVIAAFMRNKDSIGASRFLINYLKINGVPDTITLNSIIESFAKRGDKQGAIRWFKRLTSSRYNIVPNSTTFSSVVSAFTKAGDQESALLWLERNEKAGLAPSQQAYHSVLRHQLVNGEKPTLTECTTHFVVCESDNEI